LNFNIQCQSFVLLSNNRSAKKKKGSINQCSEVNVGATKQHTKPEEGFNILKSISAEPVC